MNLYQDPNPHHSTPVVEAGTSAASASLAMIMVHGRGATAQSMLQLAAEFGDLSHVRLLAPQANGNTWYPYSFLTPTQLNQPGIASGLAKLESLVSKLEQEGFTRDAIVLLGFSQGACLSLEFAARNPHRIGHVFGLSGGVIGDDTELIDYPASMEGLSVFMGCSDVDSHIPLQRVERTAHIFTSAGARVDKRIYPGMGHYVNEDELAVIQQFIATRKG